MSQTAPTFTRERQNPVLRLFLKAPKYVYHGPIADLLAWRCVMLLTTTGRKSGLPRTNGISFMPLDDRFIVFSGWGISSNWYRNVRANPEVIIQVGRRRLRATARLVEDPERRRELMLQMQQCSAHCGPPRFLRPLLRLTRMFDYDAEIRMAVEQAGNLPVVEIVPHGEV